MQKRFLISFLVMTLITLASFAQKAGSTNRASKTFQTQSQLQYGIASFYDDKFEGRQASNGEVFTQKKLTAASNTLPLNCWVKVTNLSNKRSVVVRITDRMHPKNKRLIDLSRSAASKLAYLGKGITRVKVEYLGNKKPEAGQTL